MNEQEIQPFEKHKFNLDPADDLLFAGFTVKATPQEIDRIKQFILKETTARLIYQHKDNRYLFITSTKPEQMNSA